MTRIPFRTWLLPALLAALLLPACGGDDGGDETFPTEPDSTGPPPTPFVEDSLVFRRLDGSVIEMGGSSLHCCGLYDPGWANEHAIRVMYWPPTLQTNSWSITILTGATAPGSVHTLPINVVRPHKVPAVQLFVHGGEYSSETDEASGTITLHSFECAASTMSLDFSVDAVLDSEYSDGSQVTVQGRFRAVFPRTACPG
jgi:hypothetical protein